MSFSSSSNELLVVQEGPLVVVTLHRPEVRNALTVDLIRQYHTLLDQLRLEETVEAVLFTGAGDQSFISGRQVQDLLTLTRSDALEHVFSDLLKKIETFPKPTLAAVNGYTLGGGFEFALACDIRLASENAQFGFPELRFNIIPGAGGTQRLPRMVGLSVAKDLILTGRMIDAKRAYELGLVSEVVTSPDLLAKAKEYAQKILEKGPLAVRLAKLALNISVQTSQDTGLVIEQLIQATLFETQDKVEGVHAFLEKRKPQFKNL